MSLLTSHLEQMSLSSESIATLPFPPPKIFTNALLAPHDITALIRDTEPHERALFSVPPPPPPATSQSHYADAKAPSTRRQTVFNVKGGEVTSSAAASSRVPRRNTAVAAVLGSDLNSEIRKGDVDVEILLCGAEKLGQVHAMDGAAEKITELRTRYSGLKTSVAHYEAKVARQARELERMNKRGNWEGGSGELEGEETAEDPGDDGEQLVITEEDLAKEEELIRELERKKEELEERVTGMERDLGGLLR